MASEKQIKGLRDQLERVKRFDRERLVKRPNWGDLNFEEIRDEILLAGSIAEQFYLMPMHVLPDSAIGQLTQGAERVASRFEEIDKFSIQTHSDPRHDRQNRINNYREAYTAFIEPATRWLPILSFQSENVAESVRKFTQPFHAEVETVKKLKAELDDIMVKTREAAATTGASAFQGQFSESANQLKKTARWWLAATIGGALLTICASVGTYWVTVNGRLPEAGLAPTQLVQLLTLKLFALAVLISATTWCGRNYKALKHLEQVNRHRALSIQTLGAFTAAASDIQTKDAVLQEATRAVFSHVPTGYIEQANQDGDLKIVEVARNLMPRNPPPPQ